MSLIKTRNPNPFPTGIKFGFLKYGGDEEDRTLDLTDANRALSQLSYAPKQSSCDNVNYYIIIFIVWQEGRKKKMEISVLFSRLNVSD